MRKIRSIFSAIVTALAALCVILGILWAYRRYSPSKKRADLQAWYGVSGDEVAVILDNEFEGGTKGRLSEGRVYLPLQWVNSRLNERFYWSQEDGSLIYALPDTIVYADGAAKSRQGSPLFLEQDGEVWLLAELILAYTDIRIVPYVEDGVKRVFIDTSWDPIPTARLKRDGKVRTSNGIKGDILTETEKGDSVQVIDSMGGWARIRTESGYVGYVKERLLKETGDMLQVSTFVEPEYTSLSLGEPVCMVWHQVTAPEANSKMESLIANTKGVNVIAPTWFMLTDNDGNYDSLADRSYVDKAHQMGMQVWAVLDNFNRGSQVQSEILFASTRARRKLIASLLADVEEYGLDGINLDIEGIKPEAGAHYVQFIRELSVGCRKNGIVLSVDSYVPSSYTAFYNRAEQGKVADYVVIMGYDEHYAGGEPGSVASLGYEKKGIEDTAKVVPTEKIISGIPFYTRLWNIEGEETTSAAMGIASAKQWVVDNGVELHWQQELGQYYGELTVGSSTYKIWMEEEKSLGLKAALAAQYQLAGVGFWKLGFDIPEIWDVVQP